jgi:nitrite reductase (NADH) small subunit
MRFRVGPASEIPPGSHKTVFPPNARAGIGVFNVRNRFYAVKNVCPHMGAPLCQGVVTGTTRPQPLSDGRPGMEWIRDGEILKCPWHHWEFDLVTGYTVFPSRNRVATYDVTVEPSQDQAPKGVETYPVVVEDAVVYLELA